MNDSFSFNVNLNNFNGPLEVLLDLAKSQKVDLEKISITTLVDQFLDFIKSKERINLEIASEYLLMATWLTYLKSKLLLPESDEEEFKALEVAEKLKLQLKKLELIRLLSDLMLKKNRIGVNIFYRGMTGGIRSIKTPIYNISLYELLKTYATLKMQKAFKIINIPKLPLLTTEQGIKQITENLEKINDWQDLKMLIPNNFYVNRKIKKTGLVGIFAASLELSKQGIISLMQDKIFDKVLIKKLDK